MESSSDEGGEEEVYVADSETEDITDLENEAIVPDEPAVVASSDTELDENIASAAVPSQSNCSVSDNISKTVTENKKSSPIKKEDVSTDDDGTTCIICFEPWTNSGEHRLVSLRCGHLFGKSCIAKWVKSRDAKCPQCNARARKAEIRPIFAKTIKVMDTTERDRALRDLEGECLRRKAAELQAAHRKLEAEMLRHELEETKRELIYTKIALKEARTGTKQLDRLTQGSKCVPKPFSLLKKLDMKCITCRVMACSNILGMLAVSQQSSNFLFPGYGLKKVSVPDATLSEFVLLHQKPIKDVAFHATDGLVLTASLDKSVKITSFLSNSIVQTYNLESDVWSCCWDLEQPHCFYAGVRTGTVYVFDNRMTAGFVHQLPPYSETSPVVSLQYLKSDLNYPNHSSSGPIVGQLGSCCFYKKFPIYEANPLPLEGKFTSFSYESVTGHLLASCRPSMKHPQVTHTLCEMSCTKNQYSWNFVQSMTGGLSQVQLTRSKLMLHPSNDSTVLVCAGDEETNSTLVWNGCTGSMLDKLQAESPVLDITNFRWDSSVLVSLTNSNLYFHKWNDV